MTKSEPYNVYANNNKTNPYTIMLTEANLHVKLNTKISPDAANRRYQRLVLAYQTLTKKKMYDNWMKYGDPNGS